MERVYTPKGSVFIKGDVLNKLFRFWGYFKTYKNNRIMILCRDNICCKENYDIFIGAYSNIYNTLMESVMKQSNTFKYINFRGIIIDLCGGTKKFIEHIRDLHTLNELDKNVYNYFCTFC